MNTLPSALSRASTPWLLICTLLAIAGIVAAAFAQHGVEHMVDVWLGREEYSHAILVPLVAAYLIWQQRLAILECGFEGSWFGVTLVMLGLALQVMGGLAAVDAIQQYGLLFSIYALVLALLGWRTTRRIWAPLLMLALMIPLPEFVLQNLSAQLQLASSQIGVWFIRLFGVSVFVEGNVIDLGGYKLQVAEACDGLRYLFPLMTLGFIMAYMFRVAMWKRAVLFLSAIPVTILMNSVRIGAIGVMVEHWGVRMAEGFLHDFQGWAVFMTSAGVLLLEMMLLARIGKDRKPWREVFGLEAAQPARASGPRTSWTTPPPFIASTVLLLAFAAASALAPERAEATPQRDTFLTFPTRIETWTGRRSVLEQIYLDALKLDDYVIADYLRGDRELVNFHVAWYDSQRAGQSAHSPRSCLPGGGWRITSLEQVDVPGVAVNGATLRANRVQIELGSQKQLVYYWFQQRGRVITNEYLVKWWLFWDSLTRQRTDGALVRLVTPVQTAESVEEAEQRLTQFASVAAAKLERYIPD